MLTGLPPNSQHCFGRLLHDHADGMWVRWGSGFLCSLARMVGVVFNHANLTDVIGDRSSAPGLGAARTALQAATIQLSLKFSLRANRE